MGEHSTPRSGGCETQRVGNVTEDWQGGSTRLTLVPVAAAIRVKETTVEKDSRSEAKAEGHAERVGDAARLTPA